MKVIKYFFALLLIILLNGCKYKQTTEPIFSENIYVSFDILTTFHNDSVQLALDDKILLDSTISTNNVLSLAWSSGLQRITRNNHILHLSLVEYKAQNYYMVDATNDTSTVLMFFDINTKQITFQQIKGKLKYR